MRNVTRPNFAADDIKLADLVVCLAPETLPVGYSWSTTSFLSGPFQKNTNSVICLLFWNKKDKTRQYKYTNITYKNIFVCMCTHDHMITQALPFQYLTLYYSEWKESVFRQFVRSQCKFLRMRPTGQVKIWHGATTG